MKEEKKEKGSEKSSWEPLDNLPPPYQGREEERVPERIYPDLPQDPIPSAPVPPSSPPSSHTRSKIRI